MTFFSVMPPYCLFSYVPRLCFILLSLFQPLLGINIAQCGQAVSADRWRYEHISAEWRKCDLCSLCLSSCSPHRSWACPPCSWQRLPIPKLLQRAVLETLFGTSLVVQWIGIRLPMQGTQVQSLAWGDSVCCGATTSMCCSYWACGP